MINAYSSYIPMVKLTIMVLEPLIDNNYHTLEIPFPHSDVIFTQKIMNFAKMSLIQAYNKIIFAGNKNGFSGHNTFLMKSPFWSRIDYRIILFIILMMLLPFILLSSETKTGFTSVYAFMPVDTIGTDTSGIVVNYETDSLDEEYPGVFSSIYISLVSIPADTVYINLMPDMQLDLGAGAGNPVQVLLPPYPVALSPHEVKVKPVNDEIYEDLHTGNISFTVSSDDPEYAVYSPPDINYLIKDNDPLPGINFIYAVDTFLTEGLTGITLLYSLNSIPSDTVFITADPDDQMRITALPDEPVTLVFPPNAISLGFQAINIRAYDDAVYEGDHSGFLDLSVATTDAVYSGFILEDIDFPIVDNDAAPGIIYSDPDILDLTEGAGEIEISIAFNSIPSDTVTINFIPDLQLRLAGGPGEAYALKMPPNSSALNPHIVIVKAYDDAVYEGPHTGHLDFSIITADPDYGAFILDALDIPITDNDAAPGIIYSDPDVLALSEDAGEIDISIAFNSIPSDTVTINFIPDLQLRIAAGPGEAYALKMPPNSSSLNPHIITVKAFDDAEYEGPHTGHLDFTITTTDPDYALFTLDPLEIDITDNDLLPGITVNDTSLLAGVEGDTTLFFTMVLNSIPVGTVTINVNPDAQLDLGKGRDIDVNYKFKGDSALIMQEVPITIYDDLFNEGMHVGKMGFSILTDDPNYMSFSIDTVIVEITDNDNVHVTDFDPESWNVFPSVSNGVFNYTQSATINSEVKIYNSAGLLMKKILLEQTAGRLDLKDLPSGPYIIINEINGRSYYVRVEIAH